MRCLVGLLTAAVTVVFLTPPTGSAAPFAVAGVSGPEAQKAKPDPKERSFAGCIDQQDGRYVLVNARTLERIAELQAANMPQEGFAKYLGQNVTVRGEWAPNGGTSIIKVRSLATLSETCGPAEQKQ